MTWEQVTNWISAFFDKPVVIALTTVLTGAVVAFIIFAKTSFGRKAILSLTKLANTTREISNETNRKVAEVELEVKEQVASLKTDYEQKICALISIVDYYEESLFAIIEKIPNAKVQNELLKLKDTYKEKKEEIARVVKITYQDFDAQVQAKVDEITVEVIEKENLLDERIRQIDALIQEYTDRLKASDGAIDEEVFENGETQEGENTNPTQEEEQD